MIKVLLVDDQQLLAEGLRSVLETSDEIEVLGIAGNGVQALEMCAALKPDVVLMDIRMPDMNGVAATKHIKEADKDVKIIILTTFDDSDIGSTALISAIKNAYAGDTILPSNIARKVTAAAAMVSSDKEYKLKKAFNLSEREVEIALMLGDGFTNRQIASVLKLSDGTARNYISSIYIKLGADSRASALEKIKSFNRNEKFYLAR